MSSLAQQGRESGTTGAYKKTTDMNKTYYTAGNMGRKMDSKLSSMVYLEDSNKLSQISGVFTYFAR